SAPLAGRRHRRSSATRVDFHQALLPRFFPERSSHDHRRPDAAISARDARTGGPGWAVQSTFRHGAPGVQHRSCRRGWARGGAGRLPKLWAASDQTGGRRDAASKGPPLPGNGGNAWRLRARIAAISTAVIQPKANRRLADARLTRWRWRLIATCPRSRKELA